MDRAKNLIRLITGRQTLERWNEYTRDILKEKFTSVSVEYLVQIGRDHYIPREIATYQFDLANRRKQISSQAFIKPRIIPSGLRAEAKFQSDSRHQIPIENVEDECSDFGNLLDKLYATIDFKNDGCGLLLCLDEEISVVISGLNYLIDNCEEQTRPEKTIYLAPIELFFAAFRNFVEGPNIGPFMQTEEEQKLIKEILSRSLYNFHSDLCKLHKIFGICYCSLAKAHKIWLHFGDYLSEFMNKALENIENSAASKESNSQYEQSQQAHFSSGVFKSNFGKQQKFLVKERPINTLNITGSDAELTADNLASQSGTFKPAEFVQITRIDAQNPSCFVNRVKIAENQLPDDPVIILPHWITNAPGEAPQNPIIKLPDAWKRSLEKSKAAREEKVAEDNVLRFLNSIPMQSFGVGFRQCVPGFGFGNIFTTPGTRVGGHGGHVIEDREEIMFKGRSKTMRSQGR